jgi:uncharacterized protein YbjT (DUF2867 family)
MLPRTMGLSVIVFGATGMIGRGVLLEALDDPGTSKVLAVGRASVNLVHPKLEELIHKDFSDFSSVEERLRGYDACFFCLGVTALGLSEAEYARITYDYTVAAATTLVSANPKLVFVYVSGAGTDSTEKGRQMWARVKGKTENRLLAMPFRAAYMFRPGFVRPRRGLKSRVRWYRVFYAITKPFGGMMERMMPSQATNTQKVGKAMLHVAKTTPKQSIIDPKDINALAAAHG